MINFEHKPVLLDECIEGLNIKPDGIYLDGTAGGAGHSSEIAKRLVNGELYSFDKDPEAIEIATERLKNFVCAKVIEGDFRDAKSLLDNRTYFLDGVLLDLGVSSHQLDDETRGFSYSQGGELDMRMSKRGRSAADIVNEADEYELMKILREYGEEPNSGFIARKIIAKRNEAPILTTTELSDIVVSALPAAVRRKEKHPARRTFQALRIAVNDELDALEDGLEDLFEMLKPGGRLCVITFHSLEDRIVKRFFAHKAKGCTCPPDFPVCVCGKTPQAKQITRKPIVADEHELESNRRSRSAKLRIAEKV